MPKDDNDSFIRKIPGFRSGKTWKMVLASIFYLFAVLIIISVFIVPNNSGGVQSSVNQTLNTPGVINQSSNSSAIVNNSPVQTQSIIISYSSTVENEIKYTIGGYPYTIQPDSGKVFLVVNMTIKNEGYDKFSVNPFYFNAIVNNIQYGYDSNSYYLVNYLESVDVLNNGTLTGSLAFQIPVSDSSSLLNLTYNAPFVSYNIIWSKI